MKIATEELRGAGKKGVDGLGLNEDALCAVSPIL
jgi:hypothetical protein